MRQNRGVALHTWQNVFWLPKFDDKIAVHCSEAFLEVQDRFKQEL